MSRLGLFWVSDNIDYQDKMVVTYRDMFYYYCTALIPSLNFYRLDHISLLIF